jgi:hypothetical protein
MCLLRTALLAVHPDWLVIMDFDGIIWSVGDSLRWLEARVETGGFAEISKEGPAWLLKRGLSGGVVLFEAKTA